jgi:hypothetical protein
VDAPRAVNVPPQPTTGPTPSAESVPPASSDARQKTVVPPLPPARPNVRRDADVVPVDPRAAQEFFRKREQERLRKKNQ